MPAEWPLSRQHWLRGWYIKWYINRCWIIRKAVSSVKTRGAGVFYIIIGGERGILCIYLNIIVHYQ